MYTASSNYLLNMVTSGTSVAIVKFSTKGVILNDLLQINSQSDRDKLVSSLPQTTGGSTSIGSGMLSCIEVDHYLVLNSHMNTERTVIVIMLGK